MKIYTFICTRKDLSLEDALEREPFINTWMDDEENIVRLARPIPTRDFTWELLGDSPHPNTWMWRGTMEVDDVPS